MKATVTTKILLETRFKKEDANPIDPDYPVKLRVTYQKKQKYYILMHPEKKEVIRQTEDDFKKVNGEKPRDEHKRLKIVLNAIENRAVEVIEGLAEFSFPAFELKFLNQRKNLKDLLSAFDDYASKLGEIGTATGYITAKNSFKEFGGDNIKFDDVTPDWLRKYEKSMIKKERSKTTVGFYCRNLRRILNKAINDKLYRREDYPFGSEQDGKYQIPTSQNRKKALDTDDLMKILNYKAESGSEKEQAKDYWLFSYLGNGLNPKDIFLLKWKNIVNNEIHFKREKTKRMRNEPLPITITITDRIRDIIDRQGNKKKDRDDYVFPIFKKGLSAQEQYEIRQKQVKFINKNIRAIASELEITSEISTYVARHSFASVLMHNDVNIGFISESLGHSTITTTQKYLKSFPEEARKEYADILTNFKKRGAQ